MPLRVRGSSLRLRITRGEVDHLAAGAAVVETVPFGERSFVYALSIAEVPAVRARFDGGRIDVEVPRALARDWLESERVGIDAEQPVEGGALKILLEKDFACLKPREGEDDADAYPHPLARSPADRS